MDVDLRKFPLFLYNTTQAGIGGNLFSTDSLRICQTGKFLSIPFARHNTDIFENAKNGAKNRKPFLDFLS